GRQRRAELARLVQESAEASPRSPIAAIPPPPFAATSYAEGRGPFDTCVRWRPIPDRPYGRLSRSPGGGRARVTQGRRRGHAVALGSCVVCHRRDGGTGAGRNVS